ncbi:hypothetical protein SAMN04488040_2258 [Sulfitobacter marinus]|uniref:Uncharacterized protein n=1 Tax=Sulfitobacter marinus TaxID=394264 RepID=A0A1I6TH30_9RHOB|nr:DUF6478 family protein [Sulfitobacter marinus]SFS88491.1 hypothetical protein SAMN04488040_2258 [Sulfitobacter marinus]
MAKFGTQFLNAAVSKWISQRWARNTQKANDVPMETLRRQFHEAWALKTRLDSFIQVAQERMALPIVGSTTFRKPHNADWSWRPTLWRIPLPVPGLSSAKTKAPLGTELTLFHDCALSELGVRQLRNLHEADLAPYGLRLDVFRFDGSFLSLVLDLPEDFAVGLKRTHLLQMRTIVEMEKPIEIFARLNIRHGPNTEQIVRELPLHQPNVMVEFDLGYSKMNEKRVEKAWIDLIFEGPEMNEIILRDMTFSRRPRAQL